MDAVKIEKLQAMRRYRKNSLLLKLMQYCLSLLCLGLFLSSPLWLPKLFAALSHFFFVFIPNMGTYLFCPKCFFVLGNAIVMFLVGESKLSGTASTPDIYDEYMQHSKSHVRRTSPSDAKEKAAEEERPLDVENVQEADVLQEEGAEVEDEEEEEEEEEEEGVDGWGEENRGDEFSEGEDDNALPADELNRRIEDFIARVNMQRRLEATLPGCND